MKARTVPSAVTVRRIKEVATVACSLGRGPDAPSPYVRSRRYRRLRYPMGALLLLLAALMFAAKTRAALSLKLPPMPLTFKWFYNGTLASPMCETTFRCDTSSRSRLVPVCSCHPNCSLYDACCEDVRPRDWRQRMLPPDAFRCAAYPNVLVDAKGNTSTSEVSSVFLINKCPSTYRLPYIATLCEAEFDSSANDLIFPQWVTDNTTGVTFRNQFCALCHDVTANRMIFWNITSTCIADSVMAFFGLAGCMHNVLSSVSINELIPKCWGIYRGSCVKGSSEQMEKACEDSPARYVYDERYFVTYRNYNCSLCASPMVPANRFDKCIVNSKIIETRPFTDPRGLFSIDPCPRKISTFASKDDQAAFRQLCRDTVFDTADNCSETVNKTVLLALYAGDAYLGYRITPTGVLLQLNGTYSVCYRCQPRTAYNYTLQSNYVALWATDDMYVKPLYQMEDNGSVIVCSEQKVVLDLLSPASFYYIPSEVSVVLMSLSLLGLAIYAVVYGMLRSLRNLPGQIVMHQSAYFFSALLLWLLQAQARQGGYICVAIGMLIHFSLVAGFFWTTIYAVEMVHVFRSPAHNSRNSTTMRSRLYNVAGSTVPQVIMAVATTVNWAPPSWIDLLYRPQYGTPQCFINSRAAMSIFFSAPLATFLFIDLAIYAYLIVRLSRKSQQTNLVCQNQRETLLLAIKLLLAVSPTWIFAALSAATENYYTGSIFILLISLQGVFLFFIFICNATTLKKINQKVRHLRSHARGKKTTSMISTLESLTF